MSTVRQKQAKKILAWLLCCVLLVGFLPPAHAAEGSGPIRIAFLDSGISTRHLEADRVLAGENFVFPGRDTTDRIGHGTATAGLVLGSAELGLPGLCTEAVVVPLVCYDLYPSGVSKRGDGKCLAQAIRAAVDTYGCRILNLSLGMTEDDPDLRAAVQYAQEKGALLISAVGNDNQTAPDRVYYPAAYVGVLGVGAAQGEEAAAFSQRHGVDLLAPGGDLQTVPHRNTARTETRSGTSFSCAIVSGLCASLWAAEPELDAAGVQARLLELTQDLGQPGYDDDTGWGLVQPIQDAGKLCQRIRQDLARAAARCRAAMRELLADAEKTEIQ